MNTISVQHLDKNGKDFSEPFEADLTKFKKVNKTLNWDQILTNFINGESYTTINLPYGNTRLTLVK